MYLHICIYMYIYTNMHKYMCVHVHTPAAARDVALPC